MYGAVAYRFLHDAHRGAVLDAAAWVEHLHFAEESELIPTQQVNEVDQRRIADHRRQAPPPAGGRVLGVR